MVRIVVVALALAACQGGGEDKAPPPPPRDAAKVAVAFDAAPEEKGSAAGKPEEPEPVADPDKKIAELGAVPAWQAVVDRGQYLARRGQRGIVFGTIGAPIMVPGPPPPSLPDAGVSKLDAGLVASDFVWLVDDTEGNGALGIRVMLGTHAGAVKQGDRFALGGAWMLDDARRYYWKVDEVVALPPAPPSDLKEPPSQPGHVIVDGGYVAGSRPIALAKDNDIVTFQVVGQPPKIDGEGWPVANELGDPVFALLSLPGERPSFGGQDFRTPDERWKLKRGTTYWVRIGKIRRPLGPDKPAVINARTAPVRIN